MAQNPRPLSSAFSGYCSVGRGWQRRPVPQRSVYTPHASPSRSAQVKQQPQPGSRTSSVHAGAVGGGAHWASARASHGSQRTTGPAPTAPAPARATGGPRSRVSAVSAAAQSAGRAGCMAPGGRREGLRIGGGERSGARGTRLRDVGKRAAGLQRPAAALARIWAAWESRQIYRSRGVEGHAPERRGWGWGGVGWRKPGSEARASPGSGTKDGGALRASSLGTCSVCARPVLEPPLRPREPWALPATLLPLEP